MNKLVLVLLAAILTGCTLSGTGGTGPQVTIAEIYEIALTVDTNGEVHLAGEVAIPTPIRTKLLDLDWLVAFDIAFNDAADAENTLFLLYEDPSGGIVQDAYYIDHPFEITFARDEWVRKIQHNGNGNIVVFVERRIAATAEPPITTGGEQKRFSETFYDLPEDGEVLNRFCTADWETCRTAPVANANWQDIDVASIGGSSFPDGYLVERTFLFFDTTSIPSGATIQSAVLYVYAGQFLNGNTTIHIARSNTGSPLTINSFQEFSNESGGSVAPAVPFSWSSINFLTHALDWIDRGGITKLVLIHDNDLNNVQPYEQNDVIIATGEDIVNRPYLEITYTVQ